MGSVRSTFSQNYNAILLNVPPKSGSTSRLSSSSREGQCEKENGKFCPVFLILLLYAILTLFYRVEFVKLTSIVCLKIMSDNGLISKRATLREFLKGLL